MAVRRVAFLVGLALASMTTTEVVASRGELRQLPGKDGCVVGGDPPPADALPVPGPPRGCTRIRGLGIDNLTVTFSRGGRTVYLTGESGVAVLDRDARSGRLRQLEGAAGCVSLFVREDCTFAGIERIPEAEIQSFRVAPDGHHAYLSWQRWDADDRPSSGVAGFAIDAATGALAPLAGPAGCLRSDDAAGCGPIRGVAQGDNLSVSRDGRHLYASAHEDRTIAIVERDPVSGALRQPAGAAGCVSSRERALCTRVSAPFSVAGLSLSPDGRHAYAPVLSNCDDEDRPCRPGGLLAFSREAASGMLTPLRRSAGCYRYRGRGRCTAARAMFEAYDAVVTADGRNVYTNGLDGIAAFRRNRATGRLTQLRAERGCLQVNRREGCAKLRVIHSPSGLEISPDGRRAYVGSTFMNRAIAVFRRTARGQLVQLPGREGCVSLRRRPGCGRARMSHDPYEVHVAPDGRHAYVDGFNIAAVFALGQ